MIPLHSANQPSRFRFGLFSFTKVLVLGTLTTLCVQASAKAAERVLLKYGATEQSFTVDNIETFSQTGQAATPELQSFFQRAPQAGKLLQEIFNAEIYISPEFINKVEQKAQSPTAEFILIQISKLISDPRRPEQIEPLRTAIVNSLNDDNRFSLVELVRQYPEPEIRLDLTGLEPVYNDVKGFVERVLPALEVARSYLQGIVCNCNNRTTQSSAPSATGQTVAASTNPSCINGNAASPTQAASTTSTASTATVSQSAPQPLSQPKLPATSPTPAALTHSTP
jgi:hypothetical protein